MNRSTQRLSVIEKLGYSLGDLAANLVFQTLITYLAYFYTDIYGLETQHASAINKKMEAQIEFDLKQRRIN